MRVRGKLQARKATWLALCLVLFATTSSAAGETVLQDAPALSNDASSPTTKPVAFALPADGKNTITKPLSDFDQEAEAARAYKQALLTLATLTAHSPSHTHEPLTTSTNSKSLFSSFFPNFQGQGPFGSAVRIAIKLHQRLWARSTFGQLGSKRRRVDEIRGKVVKVKDLLQHSAELGNTEALYKLAYISLYPPSYYFPSDPALAYSSFDRHATLTGNASSQAFLAFFHATGYHQVVPVDQAKAQLYYTFAAQSGDKGAQMALGYRYWTGISTLEDCGTAMQWYEQASQQAMEMFLRGPPLGATLPQTSTRLSDLVGGVYGPGASVASTGMNTLKPAIKAGIARAVGETWEDVLEYYQFNADRGETDFSYYLGKIFYQGSIYHSAGGIASGSEGVGRVPRDFRRAYYYFDKIARKVWPRDPPNPLHHASVTPRDEGAGPVGYAAASAAYLGRMYLRGEYVKQDSAMARMWFERGAETGDRECHNGLGVIWRDGLIQGRKDEKKAFSHFNAAAGQELAEAQVNLGKYYFKRGDIKLATTCFETAVRQGSPFEAYYYLAVIQSHQAQTPGHVAGSCAMAVSFHKIVAERGVWGDDLLRDADIAWSSGTDRGKEMAMLKWWIAAERGSEVAQNNLAFVLDQDKSILRLTRFSPTVPSNDTARLALTQWTRSAAQRNVDALVKVGDYYYHALGDPEDDEATRLEKAARYYQSAADTQVSALAMWNLGWMYENGVGVPQDFHLAKRHYDMALETNAEAYLPVTISLIKLHARSIWHTLTGGKNGLDLWSFDEQTNHARQRNGEGREIGQGKQSDVGENPSVDDKGILEDMEDDSPWYLGKAKDEYKRKRSQDTARPQDDKDPVQWARERRNEQERDSDFGPEDFFEGALRGGNRGEEEIDQFGETMILVALCLMVSVLLYVRTRLVERMRREQEAPAANGDGQQQEQPHAQAQAFPPAGDPARNDWGLI